MFMKFRPRICKYGSRAVYPCHRFSYLHSSVSTVFNCTWFWVYRSMSELRICVKLGKKLYSDASSIPALVHTCILKICTYLHQYAAFCYTSHYNEQVINDYDKLIRKAQAILHLEVTMKTHNHKTAQHTIVHACICRLLSIKLSFTTCIAAQA